jgi:hypothetical protein
MYINFVNPHDIMFFDATGTMKDERLARNLIITFQTELR